MAATSSVASAQRAAIGLQFASNLQPPLDGVTGKADVRLAVFLLDDSGRIQYVRHGFLGTSPTAGIVTGKYTPVFAAYTAGAPAQYPIQRCVNQPTAATLTSDQTRQPSCGRAWPQHKTPLHIDQTNVGAIAGVSLIPAALAVQNVSITQVNVANVSSATGFGGVSQVFFESTPNLTLLLSRLSSCGTPYIVASGYGATCAPSQQP